MTNLWLSPVENFKQVWTDQNIMENGEIYGSRSVTDPGGAPPPPFEKKVYSLTKYGFWSALEVI